MDARLIAHAKEVRDDGAIIEIVSIKQLLTDFQADVEKWQ